MGKKSDFPEQKHGSLHHVIPRSRGGSEQKWNKFFWAIEKHRAWHQLFKNLLPSESIELIKYWTTKKGNLDKRKIKKSKLKAWKVLFDNKTPIKAIEFIEEKFLLAEILFLKTKKENK